MMIIAHLQVSLQLANLVGLNTKSQQRELDHFSLQTQLALCVVAISGLLSLFDPKGFAFGLSHPSAFLDPVLKPGPARFFSSWFSSPQVGRTQGNWVLPRKLDSHFGKTQLTSAEFCQNYFTIPSLPISKLLFSFDMMPVSTALQLVSASSTPYTTLFNIFLLNKLIKALQYDDQTAEV